MLRWAPWEARLEGEEEEAEEPSLLQWSRAFELPCEQEFNFRSSSPPGYDKARLGMGGASQADGARLLLKQELVRHYNTRFLFFIYKVAGNYQIK